MRANPGKCRCIPATGKFSVATMSNTRNRLFAAASADESPPRCSSRFVVRLLAIEDALERLEVPDRRLLAAVIAPLLELGDGLIDHFLRELLERTTGPHGVELNLRHALEIVECVIGLCDRAADRGG